ncbi:glycosyltransferase family 4 protein [Murimonas intestini]|uniref:glycosyltransferase family 4 protein n=1 Tax=Murimonas intestini TaxID=1337051 RepID=UPI0011DDBFD7|nr:glycosyltransferase family 4 protein [Murimonas intestini]
MKVLLVATVQSHICQFHKPLVKMLHEHEVEVHVAARNNLAEKNGLALDFVEKVFDIPFARSPKSKDNIIAYKQLKKIIDVGHYDVVHCNTPMGGIVTRLAARNARKRGTKVYYTAHGFHFYKGAPKKNWIVFYPIEKFFSDHFTDKVITITKEDYLLASKKFNTIVKHMHGVGVNEEKYLAVTPTETEKFRKENKYNDHFVVLCTGELNKNKNQQVLVQAMVKIIEKCPNVLLLLAGNGSEEMNLRNQIEEAGLNDCIKLLGYHTDLEKYVNASDLVVSASRREGLPLNIMEAMICGKAVVASNNRGHRELINDGVTGTIMLDSSPNQIAESVLALIKDSNRRKKYGDTAKRAIQPYTTKNITKELQYIYEL